MRIACGLQQGSLCRRGVARIRLPSPRLVEQQPAAARAVSAKHPSSVRLSGVEQRLAQRVGAGKSSSVDGRRTEGKPWIDGRERVLTGNDEMTSDGWLRGERSLIATTTTVVRRLRYHDRAVQVVSWTRYQVWSGMQPRLVSAPLRPHNHHRAPPMDAPDLRASNTYDDPWNPRRHLSAARPVSNSIPISALGGKLGQSWLSQYFHHPEHPHRKEAGRDRLMYG